MSCAVLALYGFAFIAMPAMHGYTCEHLVETCCTHHSESDYPHPDPEDTCLLCEFVRLAIPFVTIDVPILLQVDIACERSFTVLIPSVVDATVLPPCRAPPVV